MCSARFQGGERTRRLVRLCSRLTEGGQGPLPVIPRTVKSPDDKASSAPDRPSDTLPGNPCDTLPGNPSGTLPGRRKGGPRGPARIRRGGYLREKRVVATA